MSRTATAWILALRDGRDLGFTDHDDRLFVDGIACEPGSGFSASATEAQLGFGFDNGALQGVLCDERIRASDIGSGLYTGARVRTYRVDWTGDTAPELLRTQILGEITHRTNGAFEAEAVGLGSALETTGGRVVSRECSARFGDTACGLDEDAFPHGTTCARSFAACRAFANTINYRGFPHLVGDDALLQGADTDLPRDGGSRYGNGPDV